MPGGPMPRAEPNTRGARPAKVQMLPSIRPLAALAATLLVSAACADSASSPVALVDSAAEARAGQSIVEIAVGNPNFSTLVAAVQAAGLAETLNGNRQLTVFAPTDAAFAALGLNAGNIATALTTEQLTGILLYHVTAGRRVSASVVNAPRIRMLNGQDAAIARTPAGVTIDGAFISAVDISARNGIIHVVDAVLLPDA
jgi:uncharacterized surface protein with fasciclin (FAS1) repeats